jgi:hypothetical protein
MAGKIVTKTTSNGKFMFNLKSSNGQIVLTSNMFGSKEALDAAIAKLKAIKQADIEIKKNAKDEPYFSIEGLGRSEGYSSEASCKNGVESVLKNAPDAAVVEE